MSKTDAQWADEFVSYLSPREPFLSSGFAPLSKWESRAYRWLPSWLCPLSISHKVDKNRAYWAAIKDKHCVVRIGGRKIGQ